MKKKKIEKVFLMREELQDLSTNNILKFKQLKEEQRFTHYLKLIKDLNIFHQKKANRKYLEKKKIIYSSRFKFKKYKVKRSD